MKRILVVVLFFSALAHVCQADGAFVVFKGRKSIGSISFSQIAGGSFQGVFRDSSGIVTLQDSRNSNTFEEDALQGGKVAHARALLLKDRVDVDGKSGSIPVKNPVLFFDGTGIHAFLQVRFPKSVGEAKTLQIINPFSLESSEGTLENRGYRIKTWNNGLVKLRYFLLDFNGLGINFYFDRGEQLVLVEIPSHDLTFRLKDYAAESFSFSWWESFAVTGASPVAERSSVDVKGEEDLFLTPKNGGDRVPAILLAGKKENEKSLLFPLASYLVSRGAAVLLHDAEDADENLQSSFLALLKQNGINPGRIILVGVGSKSIDTEKLAAKWGFQIRGLALLSPEPAVFRDEKNWQTLEKNRIPVLLLQGGNGSKGEEVLGNTRDEKLIEFKSIPGVDDRFLPETRISGGANDADPGMEADASSFQAVADWLTRIGILR